MYRFLIAVSLLGSAGMAWSQTEVPAGNPSRPSAVAGDNMELPLVRQTGHFPEELKDSDGDGVPDIDDNCPDTAPETPTLWGARKTVVDRCGCPQNPCAGDADGDGVNDCQDQCPGTAASLKVGDTGCPLPVTRPQRFALDVKFAFAQANLQEAYVPDLDRLHDLLIRYPDLQVTLEGHTDAKGSNSYNDALSEVRARVCRKYLLRDGRIAPGRVHTAGFGRHRPVADNRTEQGRALNRRTVAELHYAYQFLPANDGGLPP